MNKLNSCRVSVVPRGSSAGRLPCFCARIALFLLLSLPAHAQLWEPIGGGLDYQVAEIEADSVLQGMFVTGNYRHAGDSTCNGIAFWNGQDFHCFGSGALDSSCILDFTICRMVYSARQFGGQVFASGEFRVMGGDYGIERLARWDGSRWHPCGHPNSSPSLEVLGNELYAIGAFDTLSGVAIPRIAKWDGNQWMPVGPPFIEPGLAYLNEAEYYLGELVVVGDFGSLGRIVKLTDVGWVPLSSSPSAGVPGIIEPFRDQLFVGGYFFQSQGNAKDYLQVWDGETYYDPFPNVEFVSQPRSINVVGDAIYISGQFYIEKDLQWHGPYTMAKYDGEQFCAFGGLNMTMNANDIEGWDGELYIASGFQIQGTDTLRGAMRWAGGDSVDVCVGQLLRSSEPTVHEPAVSIYPNPTLGSLSLELGNGIGSCGLQVLDIAGRVVLPELSWRAGYSPVDVSMLPAGVYFVQVRVRDRVVYIKLIKN